MKAKVAGLFLFFCLIAPLAVTYTVMRYQKEVVRAKVKRQLTTHTDKEALVLLKFTEEESNSLLRWEHAREFEYNGQMYDIVELENKGDTTYYWCWRDHEETQLNKELDELLVYAIGQYSPDQGQKPSLSNFFKTLFFYENKVGAIRTFQTVPIAHFYLNYYHSIFTSPPVPPPETDA